MKSIKCFICNSLRISIYLSVNEVFNLCKCRDCHIIFTYPHPSSQLKVNKTQYDSKEEEESRIAIFDILYKNARKHIKAIQRYKQSGEFLDIGCSYGVTVKAAKDMGFYSYGVEPAKSSADYAKKKLRLNVFQGTLAQAHFKRNSFDVITLFDVLEHIPNIHKFLEEIHLILKPGGLLVVQSPNSDSFAFRILGINWNWLLIPYHLWHFSQNSLVPLLMQHRFKTQKIVTEDSIYDFASNFKSILHFPALPGILSKILKKIIYLLSYCFIFLGTRIWSRYQKGGLLRVYAIKVL